MSGVGVVERFLALGVEGEVEEVEEREDKGWKSEVWSGGGGGDGVEIALVGTVDKLPEVV